MYRMAEHGTAGTEIYLFDRVAFLAIRLYPESCLAIMARTARATFLHIGHAGPDAVLTRLEDFVMTVNAREQSFMNRMAEGCGSRFFRLEYDIDR